MFVLALFFIETFLIPRVYIDCLLFQTASVNTVRKQVIVYFIDLSLRFYNALNQTISKHMN